MARLSVVAFIAVLIVLHLARLRPVRKFSNWLPKLAALDLGRSVSVSRLIEAQSSSQLPNARLRCTPGRSAR